MPHALLLLTGRRVGLFASLLAVLLALIALVLRFRASSGDGANTKWLLVAAVMVPVAGLLDEVWGLPSPG